MNIQQRITQFILIITLAALAAGCGSMARSMGLATSAELTAEVKRQVDPINLAVNGATDRVIAVEKALKERPTTAAVKTAMEAVAAGVKAGITGLRDELDGKLAAVKAEAGGQIEALGRELGAKIVAAQATADAAKLVADTADKKAAAAQLTADKAASDAGLNGPVATKVTEVAAKADAAKSAVETAKAQAEKNAKAVALLAAHLRGDQKTADKLRAELALYFAGTGIRFVRLSGFPLDDAHGAEFTAAHKAAMAKAKADGYTEVLGVVGVEDGVPCKRPVTTDCSTVARRRAKAAAAHGGFDEKLVSTLSPRPEWGHDNDPTWRGVILVMRKPVAAQALPPPAAPPAVKPPAPPAVPAPPPAGSGSPASSSSWSWSHWF